QLQRRVDGGMAEPAARIGFQLVAGMREVEALAEILERLERPFQPAAKILEESVAAGQRGGAGGEAARTELRGENAVAGSASGMQRLGHGAEIRGDATRKRRCNAHHVGD